MFVYFNKNKFAYNKKGQLMPFLIVIMVVLIMMAMATVNLGKIAVTRTESANAADAGALAGGSVMANTFNKIAAANWKLEMQYWQYFAATSVSYLLMFIAMYVANAICYGEACMAVKFIAAAFGLSVGIGLGYIGFNIAQWFYYLIIREEIGEKGWENAIKQAHGFVFSNSGLGAKLKGEEFVSATSPEDENNYQDKFSDFMETISDENAKETSPSSHPYSWHDGQGREHNVTSTVQIDPLDTYNLQCMLMPFPAEILLFADISYALWMAWDFIALACTTCKGPWWLACQGLLCTAATPFIIIAAVEGLITWLGMAPTWSVDNSGGSWFSFSLAFTICWINDIEHDRLVTAWIDQSHQGAKLGDGEKEFTIWETRYPDSQSKCVVNFEGEGLIRPGSEDDIAFDASIEDTDDLPD